MIQIDECTFWHLKVSAAHIVQLQQWFRNGSNFYNHPELLWDRLLIPGKVEPALPSFWGDAVADLVVKGWPLSRMPLIAAAAVATCAILGSTPALLVLPAYEDIWCACETEEDPKKKPNDKVTKIHCL